MSPEKTDSATSLAANSETRSRSPPTDHSWWKEASVYQIYPASFKDSNGDGFGDLDGIISELDYIKNLNVDLVWLSPINKSPQVDMGYDIADYKDVDPRYGTLETLDKLIKGLNDRGLKFILDLVVNHTSDQHEWFKQSRSSKSDPKRDWYIWRPAKVDEAGNRVPPNNWRSYFKQSAWTWDEHTQEYYLSLFTDEQPDLNWENEEVRAAVHDVVEFWLKRGVSGFRLDVINLISKVPELPDAPITDPTSPTQWGYKYYANGPRLHEYLQELGVVFKKYDAFTVGEMPHIQSLDETIKIVGADRGELRTIFQFDLVSLDKLSGDFELRPFQVSNLRAAIAKWQKVVPERGGWNSVFIENHDQGRAISRYLSDSPQYRAYSSKLVALLVTFQKGTPFVYQGQEIATANLTRDVPIEEYKDVETINAYSRFLAKNPTKAQVSEFLDRVARTARDHGRTPMHWDDSAHGGFTTADAEPWMTLTKDFRQWNVKNQANDADSPLAFWRQALLERKRRKNVVVYGDIDIEEGDESNVIAFKRTSEDGKEPDLLVVLNFSSANLEYTAKFELSDKVVLNNYPSLEVSGTQIRLQPYQGVVIELQTKV